MLGNAKVRGNYKESVQMSSIIPVKRDWLIIESITENI